MNSTAEGTARSTVNGTVRYGDQGTDRKRGGTKGATGAGRLPFSLARGRVLWPGQPSRKMFCSPSGPGPLPLPIPLLSPHSAQNSPHGPGIHEAGKHTGPGLVQPLQSIHRQKSQAHQAHGLSTLAEYPHEKPVHESFPTSHQIPAKNRDRRNIHSYNPVNFRGYTPKFLFSIAFWLGAC